MISRWLKHWQGSAVPHAAEPSESNGAERRDYGAGIRLWDGRDPRVDHSFFQGGVPGFVLSQSQKIVDWNVAFDVVFGEMAGMSRGMAVSNWYAHMDNFRRLPKREEKLFGEAVLPLTDRERVVFESPIYGRMVFMKVMSPILDKLSGRIIGWNISLNINSVHHRAQFFETLYNRINNQSRHARYVAGLDQLLGRSGHFESFVNEVASQVKHSNHTLILGAARATHLVDKLLTLNSSRHVTVVDDDTDALRLLRDKCGRFNTRLHLVRRNFEQIEILPHHRFDAAVLLWPRTTSAELEAIIHRLKITLEGKSPIIVAQYNDFASISAWWSEMGNELEKSGDLDILRWHMGLVSEVDIDIFKDITHDFNKNGDGQSKQILSRHATLTILGSQKKISRVG